MVSNTTQHPPPPHPIPATRCLYKLYFDFGKGGRWTRKKVRGAIVHKAGSIYIRLFLTVELCVCLPFLLFFYCLPGRKKHRRRESYWVNFLMKTNNFPIWKHFLLLISLIKCDEEGLYLHRKYFYIYTLLHFENPYKKIQPSKSVTPYKCRNLLYGLLVLSE